MSQSGGDADPTNRPMGPMDGRASQTANGGRDPPNSANNPAEDSGDMNADNEKEEQEGAGRCEEEQSQSLKPDQPSRDPPCKKERSTNHCTYLTGLGANNM